MTLYKRKILFWSSSALFLICLIPLLLYSFGYRVDSGSDTWRLAQAGGLSIVPTPTTGARIFIDGVLEHETTIFSRELFLQGLAPRKYRIRIEKEGYSTWEKALRVHPAQVARAEVLLISKKEPQKLTRGEYTSMRFTDNNEKSLILAKPRRTFDLFSISDQTTIKLAPANAISSATTTYTEHALDFIKSKKLTTFAYEPSRIVWWDDHSVWIKWLDGEEYLPTYIDKDEAKLITTGGAVRSVAIYPAREAVIVATDNSVEIIELDGRDKHNSFTIFSGAKPQILISKENELLFILAEGVLYSIDLL